MAAQFRGTAIGAFQNDGNIFDIRSSFLSCLPGLISKQDDELNNMINSNFQQPSSFASAKKGIDNNYLLTQGKMHTVLLPNI